MRKGFAGHFVMRTRWRQAAIGITASGMHKVVALVVLMFSVAACERGSTDGGGGAAAAPVPARDPHKVVAEGGSLVDVRTPEEFAGKHVDGAKNIPIDDLASRMAEIPKNKPVVVYCQSGARSAAGARMLKGAGYDVIDIGPMSKW